MTVTIKIAPGEVDSRQNLVEEIAQKIQAGEKRRIFYLVPNHVKFDGEVDVLSRLKEATGQATTDSYAQSQVQVYSLSRLAYRLMDEKGMTQPTVLGSAGLFVLVSDILQEQKDRLPIFARMAAKKGFLDKLVGQLSELRASRVSAEDLLAIVESIESQSEAEALTAAALKQKLRDLAIVADAFNEKMGDDYLLAQEMLPSFAEKMQDIDLTESLFYFDGFTGFTAAEWAIIQRFIRSTDLTIALLGRVNASDPLKNVAAGSVFEKPLETARTIRGMANQDNNDCQIEILDDSASDVSLSATRTNLLQAWEKLGAYQDFSADDVQKQETKLQGFVGANVVTELEEVARRIREDLRTNPNLHLRDILVLARDLTPYSKHLPAVMDAFDLSYFLDNDVKMGNHPLVELTTTLLANPNVLYQKDKLLTVLKTGYLRPVHDGQIIDDETYFEAVSHLENYLAGHRVSKKIWEDDSQTFSLFQVPVDEEEGLSQDLQVNQNISKLKVYVHHLFKNLERIFDKSKTIEDAARGLMGFLQENCLPDAVLKQRDQLLEEGELMKAQQLLEVWQLFTNILDQLVTVSGKQPFDRAVFLEGLQAGFSGGTFSGIPNQLDQLTISEAGIVQSQRYKNLYFIGATRNALPAQIKNKSLLSDADRLLVTPALAEQEDPRYLQETAQQQMAEEPLLFYNALQSAFEKLTLSYALLDQDGKVNEPSPYVNRLLTAFDKSLETVRAQAQSAAELAEKYSGTAASTLSQLVRIPDQDRTTNGFSDVLKTLAEAGHRERAKRVLASNYYENKPQQLWGEMAKKLFHAPLVVSISQMESFYRNPYEYFLKYGLRLKERPSVEIDARIEGTVYHAIFEQVVNEVIKQNGRLADLSDQIIAQQVENVLSELTKEAAFSELKEDAKGQAQAREMQQQAISVLKQLRTTARLNNHSKPTRVEAPFGFPGSDLPLVKMSSGTHEVLLRGKVDRFDAQDALGEYGTIIDYKLNGKKFNYRDAVNGLELQLLAYWQAANESSEKMGLSADGQVGGAFFAPINTNVGRFSDYSGDIDALLAGEAKPLDTKLNGIVVDDTNYVDALETRDDDAKSEAYHLDRKKDGTFRSDSDVVSPEDMVLLIYKNRQLILQASDAIKRGYLPLSPVEKSLAYSPYQDVMRFDRSLGDEYQTPKYTGTKKEVLQRLRVEFVTEAREDELEKNQGGEQ
ncbi:PD-(D/E)XK nuclease family protein [Fructobacillus sp. M1-13]|uniref:ATP-dependent helicase n=1 Tax=Fructobacillus papyriferae TaxID=2713171 RepID=A0ABS5QPT3_9LACO|nr:PD-(D/E)XK nuclease family protein [Fructobacillus papyriferae]MBS9334912.1 ATP-dependent helicase [Fructobacillus papyriferae]MCD2159604.1 PD-(D/E)XK nuclease family protein [Fructobacillus papyriferae]